jgi:predicted phage replisome organizer
MADNVKWIKLVTDMFDNRKIKQLRKMPDGDALVVVWLQILCLAGQVNDNGLVYFAKDIPYTEEMLATEFDRPINTIRLALQTFQSFQMIEIVDSILLVSNWDKYQSVEGLEKVREKNRLRQQDYRERQKQIAANISNAPPELLQEPPTPQQPKLVKADIFAGHTFSPTMQNQLNLWVKHKKEKKSAYTPTGLDGFLKKVESYLKQYPETAVIKVIQDSIDNNYQGVVWDWLKGKEKAENNGNLFMQRVRAMENEQT